MGAVVRNHVGEVLVVQSRILEGRLSPLAAEAWAGGQALRLGKELGLTSIILEGDAKLVVDVVNGEGASWSSIGHLMEDMNILLHDFPNWRVAAVRQSANNAAHGVAWMVIKDNVGRTWQNAFPDCIHMIILGETPSLMID